MEEEGVPSTALREVSLLQMLSESVFVVRCVPPSSGERRGGWARLATKTTARRTSPPKPPPALSKALLASVL